MTILHGDMRFYNNIFVQKKICEDLRVNANESGLDALNMLHFTCGTKPYDDYPRADTYFAQFTAESAIDHLGKNIYYDHLPEFEVMFINTSTLGEAFEPEQKFEAPDGSPILFDRDFFGKRRGTAVIPGPFSCGDEVGNELFLFILQSKSPAPLS